MEVQAGEIVLYGTEGICKMLGTEEKRFGADALMYYVLESQSKGSRIFVPFANQTLVDRIRKPLAEDEMKNLLESFHTLCDLDWIENDRERKAFHAAMVANGKSSDLLVLMKTVQNRRAKMESIGKKLYAHDDRAYREARALFVSEMMLSLNANEQTANELLYQTWEALGVTE